MPKSQTAQQKYLDSLEKIDVKIYENSNDGSIAIARQIADLIRAKQKLKQKCVRACNRVQPQNSVCRAGTAA